MALPPQLTFSGDDAHMYLCPFEHENWKIRVHPFVALIENLGVPMLYNSILTI